AFVLIPHLDPHHESVLAELISKETEMPVVQVQKRSPVEPNRVYVMTPKAPLSIEGGVLVPGRPTEVPRTPIDRFFRSLAEDQGENGIRSEEHTSELQSRLHLVCRLLLEKK